MTGPKDERDDVERLLRLAGPRPEVPESEIAWLRREALADLRRETSRRARRRALGTALAAAAVLLVAVGATLLLRRAPPPALPIARLEHAAGAVASDGDPVAAGAELEAGARLETGSAPSDLAAFRTADGHRVRLDAGTRVRLFGPSRLELAAGALYVEVASGGGIAVETPRGVVRDVGTRFEVRVCAACEGDAPVVVVRVRDGQVALERDGRTLATAGAGGGLRVGAGGAVAPIATTTHGESWDWVAAASAGFAIEGRPLREYLEWVVVENGWRLDLSAPGLDPAVLGTVLHGDVTGAGRDAALDAVLAGCGLAFRVENGRLVIAPELGAR